MEGSYWMRLGSIVAMTVGCVYVLLPSFLIDREIEVEGGTGAQKEEKPLDAWFTTADKSPDLADIAPVEARLRVAGLNYERVETVDDRLVVHLRTGTSKVRAVEAVLANGKGSVHALADVDGLDGAWATAAEDRGAALSKAMAGKKLIAGAPDSGVTITGLVREGAGDAVSYAATVQGAWPAGASELAVAVDDRVIGYASAPGADGKAAVHLVADSTPAADLASLAGAQLPEPLSRVVIEQQADEKKDVQEVAWWEGLLPNTALNLGLDLQGGIDLTLQVDLDEAVFAQVKRDQASAKDQATRDGFEVEITRDRSRPAMRFAHNGEFAALKDWVGKNLRSYAYTESVQEDGKTWHVWLMLEAADEQIRSQAVDQVLETLRKRVDSTGVKEPAIVKMPGGRINIQLPGVKDAQAAVDAVGTQAILEFRLVDKDASDTAVDQMLQAAKKALPPEQFEDDQIVNEWLHENGKLAADRVLLWEYNEDKEHVLRRSPQALQVYDQVLLTGSDVAKAFVNWDSQSQEPFVHMEFKPQGARVFCEVTTAHVKERFAIILDGQVRSAPSIREKICGGSASIEMGSATDPVGESNMLALVLRTGSLTAPVDVGEVREVGPNLGADAINSGIIGAFAGGGITLLFMAVWYRTAGMVANLALMLNVLLVFALLAMFGATLTLPGIAGVALTIGMAVDANIIVYERIREELAVGRTARSAVDNGYNMGITAVIDANLTTAIAGIVLYSYGTGPIKGFAVTLLIGIITTITTGVYVSRTFLEILTRNSNSRLKI